MRVWIEREIEALAAANLGARKCGSVLLVALACSPMAPQSQSALSASSDRAEEMLAAPDEERQAEGEGERQRHRQ